MDKRELLHLRASILAGEIRRVALEAREAGEQEAYRALKRASRELPNDEATYSDSLKNVRGRLTPEVAAAIRPGIEHEAQEKAAGQYAQRQEALDLREAGMDHQPKTRYPWIALGGTVTLLADLLIRAVA